MELGHLLKTVETWIRRWFIWKMLFRLIQIILILLKTNWKMESISILIASSLIISPLLLLLASESKESFELCIFTAFVDDLEITIMYLYLKILKEYQFIRMNAVRRLMAIIWRRIQEKNLKLSKYCSFIFKEDAIVFYRPSISCSY